MPERFSPQSEKSTSDDNDGGSANSSERPAWKSPEPPSTESPQWASPNEARPPIIPESSEVSRYAAEQQARSMNEWSFGQEKSDNEKETSDDEKESKKPKRHETAPLIEPEPVPTETPTEYETISAEPDEPSTEHIVETAADAEPAQVEETPTPESVEAAKEVAQEQLEAYPATAEEDPTVAYLERVAEDGQPLEAEQETIEAHHLQEAQAEADALIEDFEDLLQTAAERIGDREVSDEELMEIVHEIVPDDEPEVEQPEAFAPEPKAPEEIPSAPETTATTHNRHNFYAPPVTPTSGSGSIPPIPPSGGGGGGGGGGSAGGYGRPGGAPGMPSAVGAISPNLQSGLHGLSAAERARMRRKTFRTALFAGVLGYYIGRHFGKKKGEREKAAELEPKFAAQEKVNERQRDEIVAGQKRIESLKRIKEAKELDEYKRDQRDKFAARDAASTEAARQSEAAAAPIETNAPSEAIEPANIGSISPEQPFKPEAEKYRQEPSLRESIRPDTVPPEIAPIDQEPPVERGHIPTPSSEIIAPVLTTASGAESSGLPEKSAPELASSDVAPEMLPAPSAPFPETPEIVESSHNEPVPESEPNRPTMQSFETGSLFVEPQELERAAEIPQIESARTSLSGESHEQPIENAPRLSERLSTEVPAAHRYADMATYSQGIEMPDVMSASEAVSATVPEMQMPEDETAKVETMNIPELLAMAKGITVGGENVGQLFEEKNIDKAGLKRVVAEYIRGGNPEQVLAQERRDIEPRHESPEFLPTSHGGAGSPGMASTGGGSGLLAETSHPPQQLLPAYDHEQYPSDTPQHLLPEYDQATTIKRHYRTVALASSLIGVGVGIIIALLLL